MKNLFKKLSAVLVAVTIAVTGLSTSALAEIKPAQDTATVTVQELEPGTNVKLYQIVQPKLNTSGELIGYEFVAEAASKLVGPNEKVTIKDASDNEKVVKISELDVDKDGIVDEKVTIDEVEYTVDATKVGKIIYDMEHPNQTSINLAVANSAHKSSAVPEPDKPSVAAGTNYWQADVKTGQYIGIITPPAGSKYSYNPIVLSAGYEDAQVYKLPDAGTDATHYKLKSGYYTTEAPTETTYQKYDNCSWVDNAPVFTEDSSDEGVTAGEAYKKLYVADGDTKETRLLAKDLTIPSNYTNYATGSTAIPKRTEPGISKTAETDTTDTGNICLLATDSKGEPIVDAAGTLTYIKAPANETIYNNLRNGTHKYSLVDGAYVEDPNGTVTLADMQTTDAKEAATVSQEVYTGGQGEEIRYTLTPTIPQYPANAKNKTFVITDKMSEGLDFVEGSVEMEITGYDVERKQNGNINEYYVYESAGTFTDATTDAGKYYKDGENYVEISATSAPTAGATIYTRKMFAKLAEKATTATLTDDFQANFIYDNLPGNEGAKNRPVLKYKAVFTAGAIEGFEGNPNVARAFYAKNTGDDKNWDTDKWERPSGEDYNEWRDVKKVYTYEIRFRKTNDKPEYITVDTGATHYVLKKESELNDAQKALLKALVKADGTPLYTEGLVELANGAEEMRYVTTVAPTADPDNSAIYEDSSKMTVKKNPEFKTLTGAKFGLYPTKADAEAKTNLITEIEVGSDGIGFSTKVANGTYFLRELVAPTGYTLSNEITGPVEANWTSCTVETTETTERKVYTVDISKAIDVDGDGTKPAIKDNPTDTVADNNTISNAAGNVLAEDQVGWLVGTGADAKFYENQVYQVADATKIAAYYEDKTTVGTTEYASHTLVLADGTVINNVFRAYLEKATSTSSSGTATYYNNNGGTIDINRINNTDSNELPSTGGIGTYIFTIAGVAILSLAAFMLIFRKKEENA